MPDNLYDHLHAGGLISDESLNRARLNARLPRLFSVHWEIRTLLYVGVLLLTTGLGMLVYENIDSIGHGFVLLLIAAICGGCFIYCFKHRAPFSAVKVKAPNPWFDYILLLGCISMLIFVGYLQVEYKVFGTNYGMATFIPMLILFFVAYYFDHLGILSMAIANLAVWMGVSVTPQQLLQVSNFDNATIIFTYLSLGLILMAGGFVTQYFSFKNHFKFSYQHYGLHVTYIALLAGYFFFYDVKFDMLWLLGVGLLSVIMYRDAFKYRSFYFLLLVILYSYIALSSLVVRMFIAINDSTVFQLLLLYFIVSGIGFILLLINLNKKLKAA